MTESEIVYSNINKKASIVSSKSKRRKIIAKEKIAKGTTIFTEEAFAAVVNEEDLKYFCNQCFKDGVKLFQCSRCKHVAYCSRECQKQHYKYHKNECTFMSSHRLARPLTHYRLLNQIILKMKEDPKAFEAVNNLINHTEEYKKNHSSDKDDMYQYALSLKYFTGYENDIDSLISLYVKVNCNCMGISIIHSKNFASALFLNASMLNHNCKPNCTYYFEKKKIVIRSLRTIEKGEELTTTYIAPYISYRERHKYLMENYYFECNCDRCLEYKGFPELDPLEGVKCTTPNCKGYISQVDFNPCPICHTELSQEHKKMIKRILDEVNSKNTSDYNLQGLKEMKKNLENIKKYFSPYNAIIEKNLEKQLKILHNIHFSDEIEYKKKTLEIKLEARNLYNNDIYKTIESTTRITNLMEIIDDIININQGYILKNLEKQPLATRKFIDQLIEKYKIREMINTIQTKVNMLYDSDSTMNNYSKDFISQVKIFFSIF